MCTRGEATYPRGVGPAPGEGTLTWAVESDGVHSGGGGRGQRGGGGRPLLEAQEEQDDDPPTRTRCVPLCARLQRKANRVFQ